LDGGLFNVSLQLCKKIQMSWWLFTIPFISAFIHWLMMRMALKLLFHPRHPRRIVGFRLKGVFPKRQRQLAESLGKIVARELFSFEEFEHAITDPENAEKILPLADQHIDHFLRHKLKEALPVISMFIGEKTNLQLKTVFLKELEELFPLILKNYVGELKKGLDMEKIVTAKITRFSSERLEPALNHILAKEFHILGWIAAGWGFLIGLLQILLTLLVK
jgi:uncharacterized membrane protein YheB (UPF0754 family)